MLVDVLNDQVLKYFLSLSDGWFMVDMNQVVLSFLLALIDSRGFEDFLVNLVHKRV